MSPIAIDSGNTRALVQPPQGLGRARPPWLFFLAFSLCLACRAQPSADKDHAATSTVPVPSSAPAVEKAPAEAVAVRLGFQKIGPPFLLKARSESLERRLTALHAKAEWIEFQTGPLLLEAIRARAVDIGYVGETPPVFAQAGGVPFVYVATDPPAPQAEAIIVPKASQLQKLEDLRGKKIALNRGSNVHYLLLRALERAKLALTDVTVVYLAPPDARSAFDTGQVDAWIIWDPFLAAAELAGARILADGVGLADNHLFYVVRREFAEQQPALVSGVLEEYRQLSEWAGGHAEEASKLLAASSGVAYEALLRAERRHPYGLLPITAEILTKQQTIADAFQRLELIPNKIQVDQAYLPAAGYTASR